MCECVKVWKYESESGKFNRYVKNICMRVIQHSCSVDRQVKGSLDLIQQLCEEQLYARYIS